MTVGEYIVANRKVAEQAFTPKRTSILPRRPRVFSTKSLKVAIKQPPNMATSRIENKNTSKAVPADGSHTVSH